MLDAGIGAGVGVGVVGTIFGFGCVGVVGEVGVGFVRTVNCRGLSPPPPSPLLPPSSAGEGDCRCGDLGGEDDGDAAADVAVFAFSLESPSSKIFSLF